jgi:tetratricopeptide (TPR) repeat protein
LNGNLSLQADPWFDEGFAEYFSSIEVDSREARIGKIPAEKYLILQQGGMMHIADLFKVQQNTRTYNESGDHRSVFYAQSGMLMHYLYDNQLIPKVALYFDAVRQKQAPIEDAIQQAFGMSPAQFDKALRNYVSQGRYRYYPMPTPQGINSKEYVVTPLTLADGMAVLADIHLHSPDYREKAVSEFEAILKTNPNHAASLRGLGYACLEKQDFDRAGAYFKKAAEADSRDPRVHYYSALLMSRHGSFVDQSNLPAIIKELEASLALDPNFADSYMLLAFAQSYSGDPAKGLESMRKAVAINPRNDAYLFNLAQLYLNNSRPDEAIAILQSLQGTDNPQLAFHASELLTHAKEIKLALQSGAQISSGPVPGTVLVNRLTPDHPSNPQEQGEAAAHAEVTPPLKTGPPKFLKGRLVNVDCSAAPVAVLTVISGTKSWKMKVVDSKHVIVIGADEFSCAWSDQKIALNYHDSGEGQGTVMTVEIQ